MKIFDPGAPILPFYFPTTVLHVDDQETYVELMSSLLDPLTHVRGFVSAREALAAVQAQAQVPQPASDLLYQRPGRDKVSEELVALDVENIHRIVYDADRFAPISVAVVDYYMPEMSGLDFIRQLPKHQKKILLTGRADHDVAIKAFNAGLIDRFIQKNAPDAHLLVQKAIDELQYEWMATGSALVAETLALNGFGFLRDAAVIEVVRHLLSDFSPVEMYVRSAPPGFLCLDAEGAARFVMVMSERELQEQVAVAEDAGSPADFLARLRSGEFVPWYADGEGYCSGPEAAQQAILAPARFVRGATEGYYVAAVADLRSLALEHLTTYEAWLRLRDAQAMNLR